MRWRGICYGDVGVCVSITLTLCASTTESIIMQTSPDCSLAILSGPQASLLVSQYLGVLKLTREIPLAENSAQGRSFIPRSVSYTFSIIGPHRMHEMRTIAIDVPGVCQSPCHRLHEASLCKQLNGSRSCLEWRLLATKGTLY